jgi:hypothetical protein
MSWEVFELTNESSEFRIFEAKAEDIAAALLLRKFRVFLVKNTEISVRRVKIAVAPVARARACC